MAHSLSWAHLVVFVLQLSNAEMQNSNNVAHPVVIPQWIVKDSEGHTCIRVVMNADLIIKPNGCSDAYLEIAIPSTAMVTSRPDHCEGSTAFSKFVIQWEEMNYTWTVAFYFQVLQEERYEIHAINGTYTQDDVTCEWSESNAELSKFPKPKVVDTISCVDVFFDTLKILQIVIEPYAQRSHLGIVVPCPFKVVTSIPIYLIALIIMTHIIGFLVGVFCGHRFLPERRIVGKRFAYREMEQQQL